MINRAIESSLLFCCCHFYFFCRDGSGGGGGGGGGHLRCRSQLVLPSPSSIRVGQSDVAVCAMHAQAKTRTHAPTHPPTHTHTHTRARARIARCARPVACALDATVQAVPVYWVHVPYCADNGGDSCSTVCVPGFAASSSVHRVKQRTTEHLPGAK